MNFFIKPYTTLFLITLTLGIFISLSSNNWLFVWFGLELNLFSFIPLALKTNKNQEKEAILKYFLVQAIASIILLTAFLTSQNMPTIILTSLLIKLGIAPSHFWLAPVINAISWNICWILATLQKISPIVIISQILSSQSTLFIFLVSRLRALTGGIGGLNQTQLRAILAYSSIGHIGWILAASLTTQRIIIIYLFSYIIIVSAVIQPINLSSISIINSQNRQEPSLNVLKLTLIPTILRLGGLPPIFGFFPKLIVIYSLSSINLTLLQLILILSSTLNLYYYLKIITSIFFSSQKLINNFYSTPSPILLTSTLLASFSGVLLIPLIF